MKTFVAFLIIFLSTSVYGHEFYFGFAEVEYNEISRKYEVTLVMSTHDMENALKTDLNLDVKLEKNLLTAEEHASITSYIGAHFKIKSADNISFILIGTETMTNGITHFYLESEPVELSLEMEWKFDLLMNHFSGQQNKLTFYFRDQQFTLTFLHTSPSQTLKLETNGL